MENEFRAWIIKENKYLFWDGMYGLERHEDGLGVHVAIADHCYLGPEEIILEQYIGLKGMNAVKIFKGDKLRYNGEIGDVVWSDEACNFCIVEPGTNALRLNWGLWWKGVKEFEVIGNIHEGIKNKEIIHG